ncbi:integrase [Ancylobacter sp. TS-1]|uniref:integrase n=1 Tax=Ancylobacter sp. TS-1 TaxID=1850374 RepID=UPI001265CF36|nr:integrase [Ancylobacter sp. TS-1]QFR32381.1 integrase [Ancylobacter sp. TS-1]
MALTTRTGMDRATGRLLRGRAHAEQSERDILSTRTFQRVMNLDYGSDLAALRGENLTAVNVLKGYAEIVQAVHRQEPGIRIARMEPTYLDGRAGAVGFDLYQIFYPYGHLGDYSVAEGFTITLPASVLVRGSAAA